jgi:hypothetical protein
MPRVTHVKKARKDNPAVKKGEPYYWWAFQFAGKRYSKTYPKRSQLTQSSFLSTLWDMEDGMHDRFKGCADQGDFESARDDLVSEITELADETQGSLDNMPDQLQEADTGQMLQERIEALEGWANELEGVDCTIDIDDEDEEGPADADEELDENDPDQELKDRIEEICNELTSYTAEV